MTSIKQAFQAAHLDWWAKYDLWNTYFFGCKHNTKILSGFCEDHTDPPHTSKAKQSKSHSNLIPSCKPHHIFLFENTFIKLLHATWVGAQIFGSFCHNIWRLENFCGPITVVLGLPSKYAVFLHLETKRKSESAARQRKNFCLIFIQLCLATSLIFDSLIQAHDFWVPHNVYTARQNQMIVLLRFPT